jgi:hypothetical protein
MKTLSVEEYREIKLLELNDLEKASTSWGELRFVLDKFWFKRVREVIDSFDDQLQFKDGAYDLFRIFSNELNPAILNKKLIRIEAISREQKRLRSYRKTRGELASKQSNQILGAIFEINIVYAAIQTCTSVEVFPKAEVRGSEVEARVIVDRRPIFLEAKALTYSKHDISAPYTAYVGTHSIDSMIKQIHDALDEKLAQGKQLQLLSKDFPTVLFLALGSNADEISGPLGIESFYQEHENNVSSIVLFGSAICRNMGKAYQNIKSSYPLTQKERQTFENAFYFAIRDNGKWDAL